jgi:hypothetical protein
MSETMKAKIHQRGTIADRCFEVRLSHWLIWLLTSPPSLQSASSPV